MADGERVSVGGHVLQLTHLDKVLYPDSGTTKRDVLAYYAAVAEWMLPHTEGRPATRKRWVNGVSGDAFFEKNLPDSAPSWIPRHSIEHQDHANVYPLVDDLATLTWLGQVAALEIHVPQWRFGPRGAQRNPDRLVLDLDPGEGVGLAECVFVAREMRGILRDMGLDPVPVTSGSKGIHVYAALDGTQSTTAVSEVAHELARALEADHPDLVLSTMGKQDRRGKVFVDWSQNNGSKTTIAPYSLRGRSRPTVAAPRTWRELASKSLRQLEYHDVLKALARRGDPMAGMSSGMPAAHGHGESGDADVPEGRDRLTEYRSKRDPQKTAEPVPEEAPQSSDGRSFVIQEHHARRLHFDFRLEHDGVLVSWALPKGEPQDPSQNHLAVQTEDHPLEYGTFEGTIAKGEYGAGEVTIWDSGTYTLEKWRDGKEIIVVLHGEQRGSRRIALIHTGSGGGSSDHNWLMHRMKDDDAQDPAPPRPTRRPRTSASPLTNPAPMLATPGSDADRFDDGWAFELKWDGVRVIATVHDGEVTLASRGGHDMTPSYPEFAGLAARLGDVTDAVLDGEIVAVDAKGRPDFGLLQTRMRLTRARDVERAASTAPVRLLLFDVLSLGGVALIDEPYDSRREALIEAVEVDSVIDVPPSFEGDLGAAMEFSGTLRLEGVVAKRRDSAYSPGRRSRAWVKLKHHVSQEVVVAGWRPGSGRRANGVGSLLLGIPTPEGLRYVGRVGTGFSDRDLDALLASFRAAARKTSPLLDVPAADARDAQWITPSRVGEVEFTEWTATGRLRHPTWRGWRPDKEPGDVVRES